ncbi:winged helix-turn-helix domain-containing protein [Solwaraspora sp. WMMB335]|uniref:winged helix-turn-helix domain-containing protein n=1 Tax=Solwaraspora sp. WMMB335 TaxID=3404118 RepID=UPI003B96636D
MSVSPASPRAGWSGLPPSGVTRPPAAPRRGSGPVMATVTVTVSIPLIAGEEALTPSARRLLDAARELVERGEATVELPEQAGPVTTPVTTQPNGAEPHDIEPRLVVNPDSCPTPTPAAADSEPVATGVENRRTAGDAPVLQVMIASRTVLLDGAALPLTRLEFDLLLHLVENPRRVFTRLQLLAAVWGYEHTGVRTVDVHIRRLRVKVGQTPLITTVYGVGYRLADDVQVSVDRAG